MLKSLDYVTRADLSAAMEWLSNVYNLYTKPRSRFDNASGYSSDFAKLEHFFILTDSYAQDLSAAQMLANARAAENLLKSVKKQANTDLFWARLAVFLLSVMWLNPQLKPASIAKCLGKLRNKQHKKALSQELALARRGIRPWDLTLRQVARASEGNLSELAKRLNNDGLVEQDRPEQVARSHELAVFVPSSQLNAILTAGRLKSAWEVAVNRYAAYYSIRDYIEKRSGTRGMGSLNHPHPIYGLLLAKESSYKNDYYGKTKITLKTNVAKRTVFTFGDAFEPYGDLLLNVNDAVAARSICSNLLPAAEEKMYITGGKEIEAQILGGVTLADIAAVKLESGASALLAAKLRAHSIEVIGH